jgi:hypothetical protein
MPPQAFLPETESTEKVLRPWENRSDDENARSRP